MDVELKEELDAFVHASLEEYARLFLEPGAEVGNASSVLPKTIERSLHYFVRVSLSCLLTCESFVRRSVHPVTINR